MNAWRILLALVALVGCGPSGARGPQDPLDEPWLGDATTIRAGHLAKIVELGRGDAEVGALFTEATRKLGGSLDAVAAHMSICSKDVQEGGLTVVEGYDVIAPRTLEEIEKGSGSPSADARLAALKLAIRAVRRTEELDTVHYEIALAPKICFVQRLTVGEAYETVIHELVHAVDYDPHEVTRLALAGPDEAAFLRASVLAKGGEVAAYLLATRARLRIRNGRYRSPLGQVLDLRSAAPVPLEVVADAILAPPPRGLGYADGLFRGEYVERLREARKNFLAERALYVSLRTEREQQAGYFAQRGEVDQKNLGVFERNVEVAKARRDPALLADSQRRHAETEVDIARSKAMGDLAAASIARLTTRVADLDTRLAGFHDLP